MPIEVRGSASLNRKLDRLGQAAKGRMMVNALKVGALLQVNDAKRRVKRITGNLARSIHIGGESREGGVTQQTGEPVPSPEIGINSAAVYWGTDVEYARRVELGFEGPDALGRTYHQPAQPYIRPAVDTTRNDVKQEVAEAMRDLIRAALT